MKDYLSETILRPFMIYVIPGAVAVYAWVIILFGSELFGSETLAELVTVYGNAATALVLAVVLFFGFIMEDLGAWLEDRFDIYLNELNGGSGSDSYHRRNWYRYLREKYKAGEEPVGHRFIRTLVTRLKFELNNGFALLLSLPGLYLLWGEKTKIYLYLCILSNLGFIYLFHEAWKSTKALSRHRSNLVGSVVASIDFDWTEFKVFFVVSIVAIAFGVLLNCMVSESHYCIILLLINFFFLSFLFLLPRPLLVWLSERDKDIDYKEKCMKYTVRLFDFFVYFILIGFFLCMVVRDAFGCPTKYVGGRGEKENEAASPFDDDRNLRALQRPFFNLKPSNIIEAPPGIQPHSFDFIVFGDTRPAKSHCDVRICVPGSPCDGNICRTLIQARAEYKKQLEELLACTPPSERETKVLERKRRRLLSHLAEAIRKRKIAHTDFEPDFALYTGDMVFRGSCENDWHMFGEHV